FAREGEFDSLDVW
nr:immunoglobulin heavy chain junction region [Macaca mulatta]